VARDDIGRHPVDLVLATAAAGNIVLLTGGTTTETWTFNGTSWKEQSVAGPTGTNAGWVIASP
jgi:hypothetical protein